MIGYGPLLNLGSGPGTRAPEPWVNVDLYPEARPDVVADLRQLLPFSWASMIYAGHVLEHLMIAEAEAMVIDWCNVLRMGKRRGGAGHLCIVGPDCVWARTFAQERDRGTYTGYVDWDRVEGDRLGSRDGPGMDHRWEATASRITPWLTEAGMAWYQAPVADVYLRGPWPVADQAAWPDQFALVAEVP